MQNVEGGSAPNGILDHVAIDEEIPLQRRDETLQVTIRRSATMSTSSVARGIPCKEVASDPPIT
jgi:hypothetical protein